VSAWVWLKEAATIDPLRAVPGEGLGATVKVNVPGVPLATDPPPLIQDTDAVT